MPVTSNALPPEPVSGPLCAINHGETAHWRNPPKLRQTMPLYQVLDDPISRCELGAGGLLPRREYWERPAIDFVNDFVALALHGGPQ